MASLFDLTGEYLELLEMAQDPDIDPQALIDTMEGIDGEIEFKAEGYAKIIKEMESYADACANVIKVLQDKKRKYENNIDRMKKSLENSMRVTGKTKFKTALFSFCIQKNPASLVIDNEDLIPPEYLMIKQEVNKSALKDAIKAGETFEYAHLEQTESLRIR